MPDILIIDDDVDLVRACSVGLHALGHTVRSAESGAEALVQVSAATPDVIVIDLGLPDRDGMDVYREIRTMSDAPVLVLSGEGSEERKVGALDSGADDFITKPVGMRELDARLRVALRRRTTAPSEAPVEFGPLRIEPQERRAFSNDSVLDLTPKEFDFLACLVAHQGQVASRKELLEAVWGTGFDNEHHYLKVYAYRLRRKLADSTVVLHSEPARGYRLVLSVD